MRIDQLPVASVIENADTLPFSDGGTTKQISVGNLTNSIRDNVYGAPLTASISSAMTDTSRVYVYTGTTGDGFTNGHWYYYNGSAWTDGGAYNSAAVQTDPTLTLEGVPADAKATGELKTDIANLEDDLYDISGYIDIQSLEWIANSYVKQNGEIDAYNGWHRTDYIDIGNADVVYLYATSDSANARFNCWYDENKTYISDFLCNKYTTEYTPPANARYFILSCESSNDVQHGVKSYSIEAARDNLGVKPNRPAYYYRGTLAASATHDTQISIAPKIGFKFGLYAKLSSAFAGLTIQFDAYSPNQIIIDTTNVTLKSRFHEDVVLPHGMSTIADDVTINAVVDNPTSIHVSIASKGVENTVTGTFEITAYETLKVINGNQALSDMVLSVGCATINHDVWVFGDSYMGMTGPYRWGYYLNANGYMKGIMVCASSGSGYNEAARWLTSLMSMGTPRKIVWCMGMNYNDNEWLLQTQELRELCEAKTIELILATIPSVPSKNNEAKNTYVRSSGLRYIDLAAAVGAQPDGTWYAGMLASDNVHPSVTGALALYNAAIASVPELTYD